jgi:hypothetical protein
MSAQSRISLCIRCAPSKMNLPVYFDDKTCTVAIEVDEIAVDNLLATEVPSTQAICFQLFPEQSFRDRHRVTKRLRPCDLFMCHMLTGYDTRRRYREIIILSHVASFSASADYLCCAPARDLSPQPPPLQGRGSTGVYLAQP